MVGIGIVVVPVDVILVLEVVGAGVVLEVVLEVVGAGAVHVGGGCVVHEVAGGAVVIVLA